MSARDQHHRKSEITEHVRVLDGLRAIAILLVIATHAAYPLHEDYGTAVSLLGSQSLAWFMMNAWVGVELFFILSGF